MTSKFGLTRVHEFWVTFVLIIWVFVFRLQLGVYGINTLLRFLLFGKKQYERKEINLPYKYKDKLIDRAMLWDLANLDIV